MADRGRITLPYMLQLLFAVAILGVLYPVVWTAFENNAGSINTGTEYLIVLVLPLLLLVTITQIYRKAIGRGPV